MLIEEDPEADQESDRKTLQARAPPDLDARIPRDGNETPPISPHPSERAEEAHGEDREDDLHREESPVPPIPILREREDSPPREAIPPSPSEPDGTTGIENVTDPK